MRSEIIGTKNLGIDFDDINKEKEKKVAADMPVRDTVTAIAVDSKSRESFYHQKNYGRRKRDDGRCRG